ncbi:MAG TPA: hypothetical protein VJ953_05710 [Saprospiraceae bacterium]|nr:hypothetical protein [Saprospiraceae bacterium]
MLLKTISSFLICLLPLGAIQAQLEVLQRSSATAGNCDGWVLLRAQGTAGPFDILLDEALYTQTTNGQATYELSDLCAGTYTVQIRPTNYPVCGKTFEIAIGSGGDTSTDLCVELESDGSPLNTSASQIQPDIKVIPNYNGQVVTTIKVPQAMTVQLQLTDPNGNILYEITQSLQNGSNTLPAINLAQYPIIEDHYFLKISADFFSDRVYRLSR